MAVTRISGLVSGFDTDTMIKDLMKLEQTKVDNVKKKKQLLAWQKDAYKDFSSLLRGLQSEFLDVVKPSTNLRSKSAFNVFSSSVTLSGAASSAVSIRTSANSSKGTINIDKISQLATADTWTSGGQVKSMNGDLINLTALNDAITNGSNTLAFTVDGTSKTITLSGGYADVAALKTELQADLNTAFGTGKVTVGDSTTSGGISFDSTGSSVAIGGGLVTQVGFVSGDSNVLNTSSTLASAFGLDPAVAPDFIINGVSSTTMGIKSTDTIKQMMDKINSSSAGVQMSYSSISDKFTFKSSKEGIVNNIDLEDTSGFFNDKLLLNGSNAANRLEGKDALLTVDGVAISRSSNTFEVDGTTLTLNQLYEPLDPAAADDIKIEINSDTTAAVTTIKNFVEKYNELIDKITSKTSEKRNRDYMPLTEEEREAMSEEEIKLWEIKAKSGLLRSDSTMESLANRLRSTLTEAVDGLGISLADIGITTSSNYADRGKLMLNESKLNTALTERPNEVIELFTRESTTAYSDTANRATRSSENGWMNKINDIFQDHIRITRDANGNKGILIEKAGHEKDESEIASTIAKQITAMDSRIADLLEDMAAKEEAYYKQFARMESMLSEMNSQFASVFGNMSGSQQQ